MRKKRRLRAKRSQLRSPARDAVALFPGRRPDRWGDRRRAFVRDEQTADQHRDRKTIVPGARLYSNTASHRDTWSVPLFRQAIAVGRVVALGRDVGRCARGRSGCGPRGPIGSMWVVPAKVPAHIPDEVEEDAPPWFSDCQDHSKWRSRGEQQLATTFWVLV